MATALSTPQSRVVTRSLTTTQDYIPGLTSQPNDVNLIWCAIGSRFCLRTKFAPGMGSCTPCTQRTQLIPGVTTKTNDSTKVWCSASKQFCPLDGFKPGSKGCEPCKLRHAQRVAENRKLDTEAEASRIEQTAHEVKLVADTFYNTVYSLKIAFDDSNHAMAFSSKLLQMKVPQ